MKDIFKMNSSNHTRSNRPPPGFKRLPKNPFLGKGMRPWIDPSQLAKPLSYKQLQRKWNLEALIEHGPPCYFPVTCDSNSSAKLMNPIVFGTNYELIGSTPVLISYYQSYCMTKERYSFGLPPDRSPHNQIKVEIMKYLANTNFGGGNLDMNDDFSFNPIEHRIKLYGRIKSDEAGAWIFYIEIGRYTNQNSGRRSSLEIIADWTALLPIHDNYCARIFGLMVFTQEYEEPDFEKPITYYIDEPYCTKFSLTPTTMSETDEDDLDSLDLESISSISFSDLTYDEDQVFDN